METAKKKLTSTIEKGTMKKGVSWSHRGSLCSKFWRKAVSKADTNHRL